MATESSANGLSCSFWLSHSCPAPHSGLLSFYLLSVSLPPSPLPHMHMGSWRQSPESLSCSLSMGSMTELVTRLRQQAFTMSNRGQSFGLSFKLYSQHMHICAGARATLGLWRPEASAGCLLCLLPPPHLDGAFSLNPELTVLARLMNSGVAVSAFSTRGQSAWDLNSSPQLWRQALYQVISSDISKN